MNDDQLLRYSRQILLPDVDIAGQEKLLQSRVLIMGLGGLGAPVAMYLASSGIGSLTLADYDEVDLSNLQRQVIHGTDKIGVNKAESAKQALEALNPEIDYHVLDEKLSEQALTEQVKQQNIVVDCTDNFTSRFAINRACVTTQTPLVSGAVIRMEGQASTYDYRESGQACYQCLYSEEGESEDTCSTTGVMAPVAGMVGSIQATEVLKLLLDMPTLSGEILLIDAKQSSFRKIKLMQDPKCPVCAQG